MFISVFLPCGAVGWQRASYATNLALNCDYFQTCVLGVFECQQHIFWLRNKKNNFRVRTLIWGPAGWSVTCDRRDSSKQKFVVIDFLFETTA